MSVSVFFFFFCVSDKNNSLLCFIVTLVLLYAHDGIKRDITGSKLCNLLFMFALLNRKIPLKAERVTKI